MNLHLANKFALVTGGSHGIGRSIALALADEGCNVAICARRTDELEDTLQSIKFKSVQGLGIKADVMIKSDIDNVFKQIIDKWKTLHILINNVGGGGRWGTEVPEEASDDVWMDVYNKNAMAAIRFTMLAIPYMRKQKWGRVVTISSMYGREGGGKAWFNMAKSAEISLMKTLAMNSEIARDMVTFNSVAPGNIMISGTGWDMEKKNNPTKFADIEKQFPLGRLGTPDEVANVVTFICSTKSSLINGACIAVDGAESRSF